MLFIEQKKKKNICFALPSKHKKKQQQQTTNAQSDTENYNGEKR